MREDVRSFLNNQQDIEVVAEAHTGQEAIALASETIPDVVLMDSIMPQMDGVEATRQVKHSLLPLCDDSQGRFFLLAALELYPLLCYHFGIIYAHYTNSENKLHKVFQPLFRFHRNW